ncbi:MAG: hypothetical protein M0C28_29210 [Candidatus Moduliflexus flocculans]|nr:hypothetical protein [Candidatus Moduliflexus flocculans]
MARISPANRGEPRIATSGTYPVWETELGNLATIICNDVNFTKATRTQAQNGAQIVSVPTFEVFAPGIWYEQRTQVVLRAVENRVAVVKAEAAGVSVIVDPYGRIVAQAKFPAGVGNALVADVPLQKSGTPYTRLGDWMGWVTLVGVVAFSVVTGTQTQSPVVHLSQMKSDNQKESDMKKLNLFLGILGLLAALGLVYANLTLPPESIMFNLGYGNWPWAPPIIFGIVGIVLLATARIGQPGEVAPETPAVVQDPEKAALNKRLENIALGCFLVMWGGSMFWARSRRITRLGRNLVHRCWVDLSRLECGTLLLQTPHEWVYHFPGPALPPGWHRAVVRREGLGGRLPAHPPGCVPGTQALVRPTSTLRQSRAELTDILLTEPDHQNGNLRSNCT